MARPPYSKTPGVALLHHKTDNRELEAFSGTPAKLPCEKALSEMYLEENRTCTPVGYLDGTYEFAAAATTAAGPLYNSATLGYHSTTPEPHSSAPEGNMHSLGSVQTSPMLFLPSNPQLSPFIHHHHHHHSQRVPYYLESDQGSYHLREATPMPLFRPHMGSRYQGPQEKNVSSAALSETSKETRYCAVCSDYASGYHYGVWSCEGCKAFFKRSIQGHNDYMCPATNQCTIDKNRRKSCQACRLRKCYEVGMMKGGLRKDRRSRHSVKLKRRSSQQDEKNHCAGSDRKLATALDPQPLHKETKSIVMSLSAEQILFLLLEAEPPTLCSKQNHSKPYTEVSIMNLLTNLADRELVHMIAWAKKIPGFMDLVLHDQVQLLECCWLEILMIGLIWRSVNHPGKLFFAPDLMLDRSEGSCVEGMAEIFDMLLATVSRFRSLNVKNEEYVCLKATILLNSGAFPMLSSSAENISESNSIQLILDKISDALFYFISQSGLSLQQQSRRQAQLLLLLSHIRHMSNKGMEHLYNMKCKNVVPLYDLLLEMLDAHRLHSGDTELKKTCDEKGFLNFSVTSGMNVQK
ncbi:estrogen receptor isoform X1 [Erpetoichthys calabaricus]|nr:estrogen receptor isoform X1 [Erpetoichthys calabaricus]